MPFAHTPLDKSATPVLNLTTIPYHCDRNIYDKFLVDIIGDGKTLTRGYVCDLEDQGLLVKTSMFDDTAHLIPFKRLIVYPYTLWSYVKYRLNVALKRPMEVLISRGDSQPATWHKAHIVHEDCFEVPYIPELEWQLVQVQVAGPDGNPQLCLVNNDLRGLINRRIRYRGGCSSNVTRKTFCKTYIPIPERWVVILRHYVRGRNFQKEWLRHSGTILIGAFDGCMELLSRGSLKKHHRNDLMILAHAYISGTMWSDAWMLSEVVGRLVQSMVHFASDNADGLPNGTVFQDIPIFLQLEIFSHFDVYDRQLLRRVNTLWQEAMHTPFLRRDTIIPLRNSTCENNPYGVGDFFETNLVLIHRIQMSVARHTKVVYVTGTWYHFLKPLAVMLSCMSIKLNWLVITGGRHDCIAELFDTAENMSAFSFPKLCRGIAVKDYSLNIYYLFSDSFADCWGCPGEKSPLIIVPDFIYNFDEQPSDKLQNAFFDRLNDCCPIWNAKTRIDMIERFAKICQFVSQAKMWKTSFSDTLFLCFSKWRVDAPTSMQHVDQLLKISLAGIARRNLIMHSLKLWMDEVEYQLRRTAKSLN
ncbi:uncharacterized protein LOC129582561 [Paramacrobiotus metropolitanus]|uniref:uncharacterized protein LOC129582561 n=1 Tax=Paramacrobiotus metropolitanus TaxID=2943436 RepID=UPI0024458F1A|nr:uncharacterized protein LOC129582561 [Paramacrobiotus metropolitanus]